MGHIESRQFNIQSKYPLDGKLLLANIFHATNLIRYQKQNVYLFDIKFD